MPWSPSRGSSPTSRPCSTRGWPTPSTTAPATSTTTSRRRPASAGSPAGRGDDARLLRRARGRPRRREAAVARPDALARRPARGSRRGRARAVEGRPGWHIECATIALDTVGMGFDVQGGGSDLVFPHHEYSAVHAEALTATKPFAGPTSSGEIGLDGEKMGKSRGNLVFVSRLRGDGVDPMAIRLALLSGHYRTDRAWTSDLLKTAQERLATWRRAVALDAGAPAAPPAGRPPGAALRRPGQSGRDRAGGRLGRTDPGRGPGCRGRGTADRLRRRRRPAGCGARGTADHGARPFRFTDRAAREARRGAAGPGGDPGGGHPWPGASRGGGPAADGVRA